MNTKEETFWTKHSTKVKVVAGFIAGGVVVYIVAGNHGNVNNGIKAAFIHFGDNTNTITTELVRRGHPGFIVKHLESGVVAASKNHLAGMLDVSRKTVDNMIEEGLIEVLGEAV